MVHPICEFLDRFGKCFSHLWGFIIFGKFDLWARMSCLPPTQFSFIRMYYYCNNQSSIWLINQALVQSIIGSLLLYSVSLLFFLFSLCILVRIILVARSTSCASSLHQGSFSNGIRDAISTWYQSARLFKFNKVEEIFVLSIRVHPTSYSSLKKSLF